MSDQPEQPSGEGEGVAEDAEADAPQDESRAAAETGTGAEPAMQTAGASADEAPEHDADEGPEDEEAEDGDDGAQGAGASGKPDLGDPENDPEARAQLKRVIESLIFVSDRTVTPAQLARATKIRVAVVRPVLKEIAQDYAERGLQLHEVSGGYQFRSSPDCSPWVRDWVAQKPVRLSRAQLETLALVAYRQPITRPEIDDVRGVDTGSAVRVLLDRSLIKILGRKDEPGRPLLYGTSPHFLEFFGMKSLKDLPTLREFTELSEENRALFKHKTGETVEDAEAALAEAEEAARRDEDEQDADDGSFEDSEAAANGDGEDASEGGALEAADGGHAGADHDEGARAAGTDDEADTDDGADDEEADDEEPEEDRPNTAPEL